MTWNKIDEITPVWTVWNPTLNVQPDADAVAPYWRSSISNFSWGECKYAIFDGEFWGHLNFTIGQGSDYGGTRVHWDMPLPETVLGSETKVVGSGFWHADSSALGYSSDAAGRVIVSTWGGALSSFVNFNFIKTATITDQWAIDNLSYSWNYVTPDGINNTATPYSEDYNTQFSNASWHLYRLWRSDDQIEPWWTPSHANGSIEPSTSDTAQINVSVVLRYMVA